MLRTPAVAGSFYPAEPQVLCAVVEDFLAEARKTPCDWPAKAVIAPHAGYIYSGEVAARAYAAVAPRAERIGPVP